MLEARIWEVGTSTDRKQLDRGPRPARTIPPTRALSPHCPPGPGAGSRGRGSVLETTPELTTSRLPDPLLWAQWGLRHTGALVPTGPAAGPLPPRPQPQPQQLSKVPRPQKPVRKVRTPPYCWHTWQILSSVAREGQRARTCFYEKSSVTPRKSQCPSPGGSVRSGGRARPWEAASAAGAVGVCGTQAGPPRPATCGGRAGVFPLHPGAGGPRSPQPRGRSVPEAAPWVPAAARGPPCRDLL